MHIEFSDIPGHQNLFLDYLYEFDNVKEFYKINFRNEDEYDPLFKEIVKKERLHRHELVEIIKNQYMGFEPSFITSENIETLSGTKTIAVFTGQQLGLIGGPLYTIYKIITTLKLAEYLSDKFKSYKFVPVFWMAGDDHDFDEIKFVNVINLKNEIQKLVYSEELPEEKNMGSVGNIILDEKIEHFKNQIKESIRETEFSADLFKIIDSSFVKNVSIGKAFRKFIFDLFDETGLVIFDPQDQAVKTLLKPLFLKEFEDYKIHSTDVLEQSAHLEEIYHAQVKVKPINLFLSEGDGRYLIEPVEEEFRLKGKRKRFTGEELKNLVISNPELFSPNVMLRPVCQDFLFPTAFYIGGPSEVCYFAQVAPLYRHYGVVQPIIYPRSSATIVEGNITKILEKYKLDLSNIFISEDQLKEKIISLLSDIDSNKIFDDALGEVKTTLQILEQRLSAIDKTLVNSTKNTGEKIIHALEILKQKSGKAQEGKFEAALRQVEKARNMLYPNNNLQERELCIINFVNKYGIEFVDWVYNELEINKFNHQILDI